MRNYTLKPTQAGIEWNPTLCHFMYLFLFVGVAVLRTYYCAQNPAQTGDLLRHLYYGKYIAEYGLSAAGMPLRELNPALSPVCWSNSPYNYPSVALLFFYGIGKISPTIFFAKVAFTILEAINSFLVYAYSRQRILALIYWASPLSIWWVSQEGQFEPLQNLLVISALILLSKRTNLAFLILALAVQAKVTAIFLLPYFLVSQRDKKLSEFVSMSVAFVGGFIPSFISLLYYPMVTQVISTISMHKQNAWYWNFFDSSCYSPNFNILIINQLASYGLLLLLIQLLAINLKAHKEIICYIAPICFIIFCKVSNVCQPWYFVLLMPFLLPIQNSRSVVNLFVISLFMDTISLCGIIIGPIYSLERSYIGITPFTKL